MPVPGPLAALRTYPSALAFSPLGPLVARSRLGIGARGHVALTFDDGPDPRGTPAVMEALAGLGWRATFFVLADMVERTPTLVRELLAAGHEVGLHAGTHRSQRRMRSREIRDDVRRAHEVIGAAGADPRWYRPPHGALAPVARRTARALGMEPVLWTAWGRDWRAAATAQSICAEITRGRLDRGTILLHDSDCMGAPGCWRQTADSLPLLADVLASRGLVAGTVGEHFLSTPRPAARGRATPARV